MNLLIKNFMTQEEPIENFVFKNLDADYISISQLINSPLLILLKNHIKTLSYNQNFDFKKELDKQIINKFKKELILSKTGIKGLSYRHQRLEYYYFFREGIQDYKKIATTNLLLGRLNYDFFCKDLETNKEELIACLCIKKDYIEDFLIDLLFNNIGSIQVSTNPSYFALLINKKFWSKSKYPKLKRFRTELLKIFNVDKVLLKTPLQNYLYTPLSDIITDYKKITSRIAFNRELLLEAVQEQNWINKNNLKFKLN